MFRRELYHDRRQGGSNFKFLLFHCRVVEAKGMGLEGLLVRNIVERWNWNKCRKKMSVGTFLRLLSNGCSIDSSIVCRLLQNFNYSFFVSPSQDEDVSSSTRTQDSCLSSSFFFLLWVVFPHFLFLSAKKKCFRRRSQLFGVFSPQIVIR